MIALVSVLLSGVVSLLVALVTMRGSIKRDHEADWRKLKLQHYEEFFAALSGVVDNTDYANQKRYADAINRLSLIAAPEAVSAIYNFYDYTSIKNIKLDLHEHDIKLSALVTAIRQDIRSREQSAPQYRLIAVPPEASAKK